MNPVLKYLSKNAGKHANKVIGVVDEKFTTPIDIEEVFDLKYRNEKGKKLAADMYRPKARDEGLLPVAIFVHGGGLFAGTRKMNRLFCEILARMGHVVYSVEYRLITEADGFEEISDISAAFDFVKQNIKEHGGDPEKVFVIGESAGAYLALYATALTKNRTLKSKFRLSAPDIDIKGLICSSGMFYANRKDPIGIVYKKEMFGKGTKDKELMKLMNPETQEIIDSLPPLFMISSSGDFLRNYTLRYADKLKKVGHPVKLIYYKNAQHLIHAFTTLSPLFPESGEVLVKLKEWENKVLLMGMSI